MIKILHTSHIDLGGTPKFSNEFSDDHIRHRFDTFNAMIDLAIERQVDMFVVLGHLFVGGVMCSECVDVVRTGFQRLEEHGIIVVVYLAPQDDYPEDVDLQHYRVKQNSSGPVALDIGNRSILLHLIPQPLNGQMVVDRKANCEPAIDYHLGIMLKSANHAESTNPYYDYLIHNKELIENLGCDYVAVGNRYSAKLVADEQLIACCAGSPQAIDFTQKGPCHCAVVTFSGQHNSVELVEVQRSIFDRVTLDATDCGDERAVCNAITDLANTDCVLQIELIGQIEQPLSLHRILDQCQNRFTHLDIIDHTSLLYSRYLRSLTKENTVRGKLAQTFIALCEACDDVDQLRIYELALRDLLQRFNEIDESNSKAKL